MKEFKKLVDCLNRQISELESLCRLKDARIAELEKRVADLEPKGITSTWPIRASQPQPCQHDFGRETWLSTEPPHCKKCGQQAERMQVFVSGNKTSTEWR